MTRGEKAGIFGMQVTLSITVHTQSMALINPFKLSTHSYFYTRL